MGYDPNRSPSVVDNLSLGIRSMGVEDETALSQQGSTYRNGNHASAGVPSTLPHVQTTPLQPRGPYTTFAIPDYGPYYPGTPTGQRSSCDPEFWLTSFRSCHVHPVTGHPKCHASNGVPCGRPTFAAILKHTHIAVASWHVL